MFKLSGNGRKASWLLEILMIVVGINVALWFEGWFQDMQDAETAERYLADLREDLLTDIGNLDFAIDAGEAKTERATALMGQLDALGDLSQDEIAAAIYVPATYSFFEPSDFTYRSMQESGDFRLLRNDDIKTSILRLDRTYKLIASLQENYLQAIDDEYIPLMMNSFDIASMTLSDPTLLDDQLFRNFFAYAAMDTRTMVAVYGEARSEAETLVALIEDELEISGPADGSTATAD